MNSDNNGTLACEGPFFMKNKPLKNLSSYYCERFRPIICIYVVFIYWEFCLVILFSSDTVSVVCFPIHYLIKGSFWPS